MAQARGCVTAAAMLLAFGSVVVVLWLGAQDVIAGTHVRRHADAVPALRRARRERARADCREVWNEVSQAAGAAARIGELLAVKPRIAAPANPRTLAKPVRGELGFEKVDFAYPGARRGAGSERRDFARRARRGRRHRRPVGRRKVDALPARAALLRSRRRGAVTLDGVDVAKLDPAALRAEIALVPQEPFIFGASVADNIAYGAPGATREAIVAAARQAAADGFISALPQGYDTLLGERGVTLSGGERQRIAIARALLKDAPVLLLDEATSALDAENETLVQRALETLMQGRTTLVIAHRLATIVNAAAHSGDGGRRDRRGRHARLAARRQRPLRPPRPPPVRDRRRRAHRGRGGGAVDPHPGRFAACPPPASRARDPSPACGRRWRAAPDEGARSALSCG